MIVAVVMVDREPYVRCMDGMASFFLQDISCWDCNEETFITLAVRMSRSLLCSRVAMTLIEYEGPSDILSDELRGLLLDNGFLEVARSTLLRIEKRMILSFLVIGRDSQAGKAEDVPY